MKFQFLLFFVLSLILDIGLAYGAARGSGSYTICIGGPCDQLYQPAAREEPGWATGSTQSYNNNFAIISSAIARGELQQLNTNYIQLRSTLQSGATFYVSSASVQGQTLLAIGAGNVGIATGTPAAILHIVSNGGRMRVQSLTTATAGTFFMNATGGSWDSYIGGTGNYILESTRTIAMTILPGGNVGIATGSPAFGLDVSSTARITGETLLATASGNVGISTSAPTYRLDVAGTMRTSGESILAADGDNVGIATRTPAAVLHVVRNGGRIRIEGLNTGSVGTFILNTTGGSWDTYIGGAGAMVIESSQTQAVNILPAGNVGIGTASPVGLFHVGAGSTGTLLATSGGNVSISSNVPNFKFVVGHKDLVVNSAASSKIVQISTVATFSDNGEELIIGDASGGGSAAGIALAGNTASLNLYNSSGALKGQYNFDSSGVLNVSNSNNNSINFNTNGNTRMVINQANVGIGTTTPGTKLAIFASSGDGVLFPQYSLVNLQGAVPLSIGVIVQGSFSPYDLWVGTGTSTVGSWQNMRTATAP